MSLPVIQSLWIGGALSKIEQLSIASFIKNGHEFHLYTYGDVKHIPKGTIVKNGNDIINENQIFTYNNGSYAGFADWFRWELLYKKGGFWVDTDVVCLQAFNFNTDVVFGAESADLVCPAVLGFPPEHSLCRFLADNCKSPNRSLPYDTKRDKKRKLKRKLLRLGREHIGWGETGGPEGFTKALKHFELLEKAKPFTFFFPVHFTSWTSFYDDTFKNDITLFTNTYSVHLWNEMTRRTPNFNKNDTFSKYSLVEQLKSKYLDEL